MKIRPWAWLERGLFAAGGLCLSVWAMEGLLSRIHEAEASKRLERSFASQNVQRLAPATRNSARDPGVIGRMDIPRVGLSVVIAEGTNRKTLGYAAGHVRGTAYPGEAGNVCLAGHRDSYFRRLSTIHDKDRIRIHTPDGVFVYQIQSIEVIDPHRTDVLRPTKIPVLTLITCFPFDAIGPAPRRFVVRAAQVRDDWDPSESEGTPKVRRFGTRSESVAG